jgi:hypothetical protein
MVVILPLGTIDSGIDSSPPVLTIQEAGEISCPRNNPIVDLHNIFESEVLKH